MSARDFAPLPLLLMRNEYIVSDCFLSANKLLVSVRGLGMGGGQSVDVPGGGKEGYHVLKVYESSLQS